MEEEKSRMDEIREFLTFTTSKNFGNWEQSGWYPHHKSSQKMNLNTITQWKVGVIGKI